MEMPEEAVPVEDPHSQNNILYINILSNFLDKIIIINIIIKFFPIEYDDLYFESFWIFCIINIQDKKISITYVSTDEVLCQRLISW